MNKKELNNLNELIRIESVNYYYSNNIEYLKGIISVCETLNYKNEFYVIANKNYFNEYYCQQKTIDYIALDNIYRLIDNLYDNGLYISDVIIDNNIVDFIYKLEDINEELKYINEEEYNANVNKLKVIYNGIK